MYISGGDAKNFTAANHVVKNNNIKNFSRVSKISIPAIQLGGVGNSVIHNEIHDSEYSAIMFGGVNNTIQYNNIYNVCTETADAGAIYAGRSWVSRGNKILNNYIHDIRSTATSNAGASSIAGIFLDDHYAGAHVEGNIFANIAGDGIRGNGGREHTITNNIFVNCANGTIISAPSTTDDYTSYKNAVEELIGTKWETEYPTLFKKDGETTVVNYDVLKTAGGISYTKNFASGCTKAAYDLSKIPDGYTQSNNNAVSEDIFKGDFTNVASKVTGITDFANIPFASIRPTTLR